MMPRQVEVPGSRYLKILSWTLRGRVRRGHGAVEVS